MKIADLCGHLVPLLDVPMGQFTELTRALKETSSHFDEEKEIEERARRVAEARHDPAHLVGRPGPGGGVEATPFTVGFIIIALMTAAPRKDSTLATWRVWHFYQEGAQTVAWQGEEHRLKFPQCPLTGKILFGDAVKTIFDDPKMAGRVKSLRLSSNDTAEIHYDDGLVSKFDKGHPDQERLFTRTASLDGRVVRHVAHLLKRGS